MSFPKNVRPKSILKEEIIENISYERRVYESVDDSSLSLVLFRISMKKNNLVLKGLITYLVCFGEANMFFQFKLLVVENLVLLQFTNVQLRESAMKEWQSKSRNKRE